jgi:hypothetical protein
MGRRKRAHLLENLQRPDVRGPARGHPGRFSVFGCKQRFTDYSWVQIPSPPMCFLPFLGRYSAFRAPRPTSGIVRGLTCRGCPHSPVPVSGHHRRLAKQQPKTEPANVVSALSSGHWRIRATVLKTVSQGLESRACLLRPAGRFGPEGSLAAFRPHSRLLAG